MKYIIMADGKETRWSNCSGIHKWQIRIDGETLLERTVRLIKKYDSSATVIITSHCKNLVVKGAQRYEPKNNNIEIDRFTIELIEKDCVFLYGDCYYTENAVKSIIEKGTNSIQFFGNERRIFAIKVNDDKLFLHHIDNVKKLFLEGKINSCIGWQVYQSFQNIEFGKKQIVDNFEIIEDDTRDFNRVDDYYEFVKSNPIRYDNRAIAFYDSGIGGLTCVKEFKKCLPDESILYFGDTLRAPYGDRSPQEIRHFVVDQISEFLISQDVKLLIVACNTASSLCVDEMRKKYINTPVIGMIDLTARHIINDYSNKKVGIIATTLTKESGFYSSTLKEYGCINDIPIKACPQLVPLVEKGAFYGDEAEKIIKSEIDDFIKEEKLDVLVLGCTHYPFLRDTIEMLYPELEILDPSMIIASGVKNLFDKRIISESNGENISLRFCTSKLTDIFKNESCSISGNPDENIEIIKF